MSLKQSSKKSKWALDFNVRYDSSMYFVFPAYCSPSYDAAKMQICLRRLATIPQHW